MKVSKAEEVAREMKNGNMRLLYYPERGELVVQDREEDLIYEDGQYEVFSNPDLGIYAKTEDEIKRSCEIIDEYDDFYKTAPLLEVVKTGFDQFFFERW